MSLKKRRVIFWILAAIFIITAFSAVLHAAGWRFNIADFSLEKTGGIYIKSQPSDASIIINRKPHKSKSGLIFYKGTLFANLSHKKYDIEVVKENFSKWSKKLEVLPLFVTQATHIILLPKNPQPNETFNFPFNPKNIFYGPRLDSALMEFDREKETNLFIFNPENNDLKLLYQAAETEWKKISGGNSYGIKWSPNLKSIMISDYIINTDSENSRLLNIKKEFSRILASSLGAKKAQTIKTRDIFFHPFLENSFLIKVSYPAGQSTSSAGSAAANEKSAAANNNDTEAFYLLNLGKKDVSKLTDLPANSQNLTINSDNIYWIDAEGKFYGFNLISKNLNILYSTSSEFFPAEKLGLKKELSISGNHHFFAVVSEKTGALYILDKNQNKLLKPMHSGVKKIFFSPDNKKLAIWENNDLKIIYLVDFYDDFFKKIGDIDSLGKYPGLKDFFWHSSSNHLWIKTGDKLSLVEIDARDKINQADFLDIKNGEDIFLKNDVIYKINKSGIKQYKISS